MTERKTRAPKQKLDIVEETLLRRRQSASRELAVLVAVEFTSERFQPSSVAQQARRAAAITLKDAADVLEADGVPKAVVEPVADIDFDASLAEFQELARSAGATIAAVLNSAAWQARSRDAGGRRQARRDRRDGGLHGREPGAL